jgi:hypothetical protein
MPGTAAMRVSTFNPGFSHENQCADIDWERRLTGFGSVCGPVEGTAMPAGR